ncbi:MAG: hypothetical protein GY719_38245 [bacterium]|nr:hypothetical protein [bacterium]
MSTDTAHAQKSPSVACLTDGGFVLVWEGYESVKARRFSGDGIALGEEFQVNIDTVWIQRPSVSAPIDGGFVAVWRRGERIRGRRFATDGMALGEEFEIDAGPRALIPSVAAFADGDFVVVWAEAWESEDPILPLGSVHCRRFEAPRFALSGLDGKCLDIEGADPADSTSVNLFRCHGGENQRWRMDLTSSPQRIRGIGDKCLVPTSADESGDNPVVMGECDGQYDRWKLVSPGVSKPSGLIHLGTGRCLDVKAATSTDGTPTQLFECHGGANQTWRPAPVVCTLDSQGLCLSRERFRVEVEWRDYDGNTGSSWVVPVASDDSGLFWFFSEENWEMLIKVLDGCSINDRFWVYAAATTDVEYALRVTDTAIGTSREYLNPLGTASPAITDAAAFDTCSASSTAGASWADPEAPEMLKTSFFGVDESLWDGIGSEGLCVSSPVDLCLNDDRFLVEVEWRDYDGNTGSGQVVPVDARDSGILWFFSDTNWEMLVKVLDGCGINDHYWVFAAATTDVEYRLRVTDLDTGEIREYFNPLGTSSAAITDTHAFGACGL